MRRARTAVWLTLSGLTGATLPFAAHAQEVTPPPKIECERGFEGLRADAKALAGAEAAESQGFEVIRVAQPELWRAEISFTTSWHPAHPAVTLRTLRKQVTGVWTADSKVCGYGDQAQFSALVADMKAGDKALTDASRETAEREKAQRSPLAP